MQYAISREDLPLRDGTNGRIPSVAAIRVALVRGPGRSAACSEYLEGTIVEDASPIRSNRGRTSERCSDVEPARRRRNRMTADRITSRHGSLRTGV